MHGRGQLKCDGTRAETRFRLSVKRTSFPFTSPPERHRVPSHFNWTLMLDTPCSEVVWRVLATHSIRQFPLHFPSRASPCAITFQLDCTNVLGGGIFCLHFRSYRSFCEAYLPDPYPKRSFVSVVRRFVQSKVKCQLWRHERNVE